MKIGFLGHNGFALGDMDNPVLVDPILLPKYGDEYNPSAVEIYPPRKINLDQLPNISAVIISHEHSDHFHLPTLNLLDRKVPIVVGPTMIDSVIEYINKLGFRVRRLEFGKEEQFGSVLVTLYPPDPETVLWESRVSQIYVRDIEQPTEGGIYLCIDAILSPMFHDDVNSGKIPKPRVIAVSNNSQITPDGVFGSLDNMRDEFYSEGAVPKKGFVALDILHELLVSSIENAPSLRGSNFLICGGGFLKDYDEMGPFPYSEQHNLAEIASKLTRFINVLGPLPGDILSLKDNLVMKTDNLSWLKLDQNLFQQLITKREKFIKSKKSIPMKSVLFAPTYESEQEALKIIESELALIAQSILLSSIGKELILLGQHKNLGSSRFLIQVLCSHSKDQSWELDISEGMFLPTNTLEFSKAIEKYPFGIVISAVDFAAVITGKLQIWDVAGVAMRSWYQGNLLLSPVALFYNLYGEHTRPDIALDVYNKQIEKLLGKVMI
ncbi:MBL fold metallo-hydrolase [Tepidibacillus infernus]|uniref:MBL fold metallo-hydrolase n=1 Tax=Tepidibacillus infernus TaxID=1806172 RepID=UPI003B6F6AD0